MRRIYSFEIEVRIGSRELDCAVKRDAVDDGLERGGVLREWVDIATNASRKTRKGGRASVRIA